MKSKKILDVRVDFDINMDEAVNLVKNSMLKDGKFHYICTTNPEFIMSAQEDLNFKNIINESDLSVPDGVGVIMAKNYLENVEARLSKRNLLFPVNAFFTGVYTGVSAFFDKSVVEGRVPGVELTYKLCEMASQNNYNVFLLGGWPRDFLGRSLKDFPEDFATVAGRELKKKYPNLNIIGATSAFKRGTEDDDKTISYIKKCMTEKNVQKIDLLFVAYNHIWQEKWIKRNAFKIPAVVSMGVGGTFDYIVGHYVQTPVVLNRVGLSWLFRLLVQPFRFKRIFEAFPRFPIKVFFDSLK